MGWMEDGVRALDAYPKTLEEFRVRTRHGGMISLLCIMIVTWLMWSQLRTLYEIKEDLVVDKTLHERLVVNFDVTFPQMTCDVVHLDATDASGAHLEGVMHHAYKLDLNRYGKVIEGKRLVLTDEKDAALSQDDFEESHLSLRYLFDSEPLERPVFKHEKVDPSCGSCYVSRVPGKCCNSCLDVKRAFESAGLPFERLERFRQCISPRAWKRYHDGDDLEYEEHGCEIFGFLEVARAEGSFHFAPSMRRPSAQANQKQPNVIDLFQMIFNRQSVRYDISHVVNHLSFGEPARVGSSQQWEFTRMRKYAEYSSPLHGRRKDFDSRLTVVKYFVKVIPTTLTFLNGTSVEDTQYAVTEHVKSVEGTRMLPAVIFAYDSSPIRIKYAIQAQPLGRFLTNVCAIIGGVYSLSSFLDSFIHKYVGAQSYYAQLEIPK